MPPSKEPACVDEGVGVFVDSKSSAASPDGTRAKPYKTISAALAGNPNKRPHVYVCAGTYTDNVSLDAMHAQNIYGGFDCAKWTYATANVVKVQPTSGYPLQITSVTGALAIEDIEFDAPNGTATSVNSIAAFVASSPLVAMTRVTLSAANGYAGAIGDAGATGALVSSTPTANTLDGNSGATAMGAGTGGAQQTCSCANGGSTKGGKGGDNVLGAASNGANGETAQGMPSPATATGAGQTSTDCITVQMGGMAPNAKPGSNAPNQPSAAGATSLGALTDQGWSPQDGSGGANGMAGQGGGGGGANTTGGGGSGACGGCGGEAGKAGGGGGASVALLTFNAPVTLVGCKLGSGTAGQGGAGGSAGAGIAGGNHGNSGGNACQGGNGGTGGNGGAGGGGAGGVSAGILYKGTKPSYGIDTTITPGVEGGKGPGGDLGNNDGVPGQKSDVLAAP